MISKEELKKLIDKLPDKLLDQVYNLFENVGSEKESRSAAVIPKLNEMRFEKEVVGLIILAIVTFLLASCNGFNSSNYDVKEVKASPALVFPIASGELVIQDILSKTASANIHVDTDGLVYLEYAQTLKSQGIGDLLDFPDKGFSKNVTVPASTLPANNAEVKYAGLSSTEDFGFDPEKLSEIKFKSTTLGITATIVPSVANLEIVNEMPLDAFIQLYLADDNAIVYDSLFTTAQTAIVKASSVNAQGELQSASTLNETIDIPKEKLGKIFEAKRIIVKAKMNTAKDAGGNLVDVKFKASYKMIVNFGLKVKLKLEINL